MQAYGEYNEKIIKRRDLVVLGVGMGIGVGVGPGVGVGVGVGAGE